MWILILVNKLQLTRQEIYPTWDEWSGNREEAGQPLQVHQTHAASIPAARTHPPTSIHAILTSQEHHKAINRAKEQPSKETEKITVIMKTYYWGVGVWQKLFQFWHKFIKQRIHGFQKPELQISFPLLKPPWNTSFSVTKCCLIQESELHVIICAPSKKGLKPEGLHSSRTAKCFKSVGLHLLVRYHWTGLVS